MHNRYSAAQVEKLIYRGQIATTNALEMPEILGLVIPLGYTAERLQQDQALVVDLQGAHQHQQDAYGRQYQATEAFNVAWGDARRLYTRHSSQARAVLAGEKGLKARLGLQRQFRSFERWDAQARQFYTIGLSDPELQARLLEGGLTAEILQNGLDGVAAAEAADRAQEAAKGTAQQATRDRNAAAGALDQWLKDFEAIARIALRKFPEWLERLGIAEPSG